MTVFYLIRHGEPLWDLARIRRLKGSQSNFVPLTQGGIKEVKERMQDTRLRDAQMIVTSPYTRSLQTAAILSRGLDIEMEVDYDLHEWIPELSFQYEDNEDIIKLYRDYIKNKGIYPKGETRSWESKDMIQTRVKRVLKKYLQYPHIIVVCHEVVIKALTEMEEVPHAGIVVFEVKESFI